MARTKWIIDPEHSEIAFQVKHLMISNITGSFKRFDASVHTEGDDFREADVDFWMDPSSIDTNSADRDKHLNGMDFFDTRNHKQITFSGTLEKGEKAAGYELQGELTVKGITKKVRFEVEFGGVVKDPYGNEKAGFIIKGNVNRKDFGLTWNVALTGGGVMVGEEVKISCNVELKRIVEEHLEMKSESVIEDEPITAVV